MIVNERWKVYEGKLRPEYPTRIIAIQTAAGETVIPWAGFDSMSKAKARIIARRIVRLHNDALKMGDLAHKLINQSQRYN